MIYREFFVMPKCPHCKKPLRCSKIEQNKFVCKTCNVVLKQNNHLKITKKTTNSNIYNY